MRAVPCWPGVTLWNAFTAEVCVSASHFIALMSMCAWKKAAATSLLSEKGTKLTGKKCKF